MAVETGASEDVFSFALSGSTLLKIIIAHLWVKAEETVSTVSDYWL